MIEKTGYRMQFSLESLIAEAFAPTGKSLVTKPMSAEWLASREAFRAQYEKLVAYGEEHGFLEQAACYECGGAFEVTTDTTDSRWEDAA